MYTKQKITLSEQWMRDGLKVLARPGFFLSLDVDMTNAKKALNELRSEEVKVTYTHIFTKAAAIALDQHPELHQMVFGGKRYRLQRPAIALSVSGSDACSPTTNLENVSQKNLIEIAIETKEGAKKARQEQQELFELINKWGWIFPPIPFLRRFLLRRLFNYMPLRLKQLGSLQMSGVPNVDQMVPFLFLTPAVLGVGQVKDAVVAVNGAPEVRPMATLSVCCDHKVWDGMAGSKFLNAVAEAVQDINLLQNKSI